VAERTDSLTSDADALRKEIALLRERAECLLGELKVRARQATDLRAQVREHPAAVTLVGATLGALAGLLAFRIVRARRETRFLPRMRRKAAALGQLLAHPEAAVRPRQTPLWDKLLRAMLLTTVTVATKTIAKRAVLRGTL
jgi:hypothetical protein